MTEQKTSEIFLTFIDRLNAGDIDGAFELVAEDFFAEDFAVGEIVQGAAELRASAESSVAAFPDANQDITRIVDAGDLAIAEGVGSGTHRGTLELPGLVVPPTGKRLTFRFCTIAKAANGKLVSENHYYDPRPFWDLAD